MTSLQCATTLLVARHAEAEYETSEWADEGGSLTALGREQAAALGAAVAGRRVAHVWTSTMARAVQTAEIAAARLGGVLREIADLHPGETVLVVSHGGAIGVGVPNLCRMDVEQTRLANGGMVEVLADADGWVCSRWG